jgi:hypothetical protein
MRPVEVGREQEVGDLRDREDEDEVVEELERRRARVPVG